MRTDLWLQIVTMLLGLLGFGLGVFPKLTSTRLHRIAMAAGVVILSIVQFQLYRVQSSEEEIERSVTQAKLDESEKGHEFLKEQLQASLKQQVTSMKQQEISINQQQVLQAQNHDLRDEIRRLQVQIRNVDAQSFAMRKKLGIAADAEEEIQLEVQPGFAPSATVDEGPGHGAGPGR